MFQLINLKNLVTAFALCSKTFDIPILMKYLNIELELINLTPVQPLGFSIVSP